MRGALRRGADPDLALRVPFGWFSGAAESAGTTSRAPYARFRGLIVARAVRQIIGRRRAVDYVLRSRGFEPAALGVQLSVEAGGTNNYVEGVGSANVNALHDGFKNAAHLLLAALEQSSSVDVAVERGAAANLVFLDDLLRAAPADEVGFDGVARC